MKKFKVGTKVKSGDKIGFVYDNRERGFYTVAFETWFWLHGKFEKYHTLPVRDVVKLELKEFLNLKGKVVQEKRMYRNSAFESKNKKYCAIFLSNNVLMKEVIVEENIKKALDVMVDKFKVDYASFKMIVQIE